MKSKRFVLSIIIASASLAFSGCGDSSKPASTSATNPPGQPTLTAGRPVAISANDTMKFDVVEIRAKPGEALSITMTNTGTTPKFSMGHNWVLLQPDTDLIAFTSAAATAAATDYKPAAFKAKIIASTKLLGPKEHDTVTFAAPTRPGSYPFICSFPGHFQVGMKGVLIVE